MRATVLLEYQFLKKAMQVSSRHSIERNQMKTRTLMVACICLVLLAHSAGNAWAQADQISYRIQLQTTIINRGQIDFDLSSNPYTDPSMPFFPNSTLQTAQIVGSSHDFRRELDNDENTVARLLVSPFLKGGQRVTLRIEYQVSAYLTNFRRSGYSPVIDTRNSGAKGDVPESLIPIYCAARGPWQINDAEQSWKKIGDLAKEIAGNDGNVLSVTARFIEWIGKNVRYPQSKRDRIFMSNETLAFKEGDCDEQSNLLIAMLRNVGIPAYLETGALYIPSRAENRTSLDGHLVSRVNSIGWHAWAVVYIPPWGWVPVDMTIGYRDGFPLDAILRSAPMMLTTIVSGSVKSSDYVSEANVAASQLGQMPIWLIEDQSIEMSTATYPRQSPETTMFTVAAMIGFGCSIVILYYLARRRRKQMILSSPNSYRLANHAGILNYCAIIFDECLSVFKLNVGSIVLRLLVW